MRNQIRVLWDAVAKEAKAFAAAQAKAERKAAADKMKEEKAQANVPSEECCGVDRLQNFEYLEVSLSASLVY